MSARPIFRSRRSRAGVQLPIFCSLAFSSETNDDFASGPSVWSVGARVIARCTAALAFFLSFTDKYPSARLSCALAEFGCAHAFNWKTAKASCGRLWPSRLYPQVLKRSASMQEARFSSLQLSMKARFAASRPFALANAAASSGEGGGGTASRCFIEIVPFCRARRSISCEAFGSDFNLESKKESTIWHAASYPARPVSRFHPLSGYPVGSGAWNCDPIMANEVKSL